jgi:hypothetical protein
MSLPPYKFGRPPCCYYRLQKFKKYEGRVAFNGMTFIPCLLKIGQLVQNLKGLTRMHTAWWSHKRNLFSYERKLGRKGLRSQTNLHHAHWKTNKERIDKCTSIIVHIFSKFVLCDFACFTGHYVMFEGAGEQGGRPELWAEEGRQTDLGILQKKLLILFSPTKASKMWTAGCCILVCLNLCLFHVRSCHLTHKVL